jgi:hypothetical protein
MTKRNSSLRAVGVRSPESPTLTVSEAPSELLRELVEHLRQNRTQLREEWVARMSETRLLTAMTKDEIFAEATSVYDSYVERSRRKLSKPSRPTPETSRKGSSPAASRPTKSSVLFYSSVTSSHVLCSLNIKPISGN